MVEIPKNLGDAARSGYAIASFCNKCARHTKQLAKAILGKNPGLATLTLAEIKQKSVCQNCKARQSLKMNWAFSSTNSSKFIKAPVRKIKYEASLEQPVFHRSTCGWLKNTPNQSSVRFKTRDEAIQSGYEPCATCRP